MVENIGYGEGEKLERVLNRIKESFEKTMRESEMLEVQWTYKFPDTDSKEAKEKFLTLRRVVAFHKEGKYTDSELLHFLAGYCGFAPQGEEIKLLETLSFKVDKRSG